MLLLVCKQENLHKIKKRNIRFCKWMSPLKLSIDTQSEMKECHIFIAITNKVRSNKIITIRRRTFIIKVLFFIVFLLSFTRLEDDTHIKCSYKNYSKQMFYNQELLIVILWIDLFNTQNFLDNIKTTSKLNWK